MKSVRQAPLYIFHYSLFSPLSNPNLGNSRDKRKKAQETIILFPVLLCVVYQSIFYFTKTF